MTLPNKQTTGQALARGRRLRHRGRSYVLSDVRIYREDPGRLVFVCWCWTGDPRRAIDHAMRVKLPTLRRQPKRRMFGRIRREEREKT
jgi:hypothetical protein